MQITSIKLKGKNANIFTLLAGEQEYIFHSDIIVKYGLAVGIVDDEKFFTALEESTTLIATNTALNYVNSSLKTEKQVKDYLYKKGYKSLVVNAVCKKLNEYGVLNDKNFAQSYVRSNPNFSKRKLMQKLQGFGVKGQQLEDVLQQVNDLPSCKKECEKFFKTKQPTKENIAKLTRRLAGQGYGYETIKQMLGSLLEDN